MAANHSLALAFMRSFEEHGPRGLTKAGHDFGVRARKRPSRAGQETSAGWVLQMDGRVGQRLPSRAEYLKRGHPLTLEGQAGSHEPMHSPCQNAG